MKLRIVEDRIELEEGETLLKELIAELHRYCVLPSQDYYIAVALWIMASHCLPAFDIAPRMVVRSKEKRSGKTRLLEVMNELVHRPMLSSNMTEAALFHSLDGDRPPTVLLDEADTVFSHGAVPGKEGLRGVINAGFSRGAEVHRANGTYPVFAMVAIAGIGEMPDTIEDRALVLRMNRHDASAEPVEEFRVSRDSARLAKLKRKLQGWGASATRELKGVYPDLPVEDRAADTWYPLVAIADLISEDTGVAARTACTTIVSATLES